MNPLLHLGLSTARVAGRTAARSTGPLVRAGLAGATHAAVGAVNVGLAAGQGALRSEPGDPSDKMPKALEGVTYAQRLGDKVPADLAFVDETGKAVRLGDYYGRRPVVLALAYYECPMLCTQVLSGMTAGLKGLRFNAGHVVEKIYALEAALNVPASSDLASFIEMLNVEIGLPRTLRAMGVTEDMIPRMIDGALKDHSTATNPRPVTREDFEQLFAQAMGPAPTRTQELIRETT